MNQSGRATRKEQREGRTVSEPAQHFHKPSTRSRKHAALARGIKIAPGSMFSTGRRYDGCVRLSCGRAMDEAVDAALRTLGELASLG